MLFVECCMLKVECWVSSSSISNLPGKKEIVFIKYSRKEKKFKEHYTEDVNKDSITFKLYLYELAFKM